MILQIKTNNYIFSFNNVFYDEEDGLLKILLNSNSLVYDYMEFKNFLENTMDNKYFTPEENIDKNFTILSLYLDNIMDYNCLPEILYKLSNLIINYKNNPIIIKNKYKINNKFLNLDSHPFSYQIENVYKYLFLLYNHFESVSRIEKSLIKNKLNYSIYDYILDNLK
jgi:hypothetical protein